jgi:hypothetical protein
MLSGTDYHYYNLLIVSDRHFLAFCPILKPFTITVMMSLSGWLSGLRHCLPRRWPRARFDPQSQPDLQLVWKRWLFSVTLRRGQVLQHCNWDYRTVKKIAVVIANAKELPHLETRTGPCRTWNTAFKGQLKLVDSSLFEKYMYLKKNVTEDDNESTENSV